MLTSVAGGFSDIQPLSVHDGPGLRTTFFLKGCPLHCLWCHNPECISSLPELIVREKFCVSCGACVPVCSTGAMQMTAIGRQFLRNKCNDCGRCEGACFHHVLRISGRSITVQEALERALEDQDFYETSGGGVTLSGGEPLLQADFCTAFLHELGQYGIHRAIDTCGAVSWEQFEKVLPECDLFLYDIKQIDSKRHKQATGIGNEQILDNLKKLVARKCRIEIRMPMIPDYNMDEETLLRTGAFLRGLAVNLPVRLLPYHPYAHEKYHYISRQDTMPNVASPDVKQMEKVSECLRQQGIMILE